MPVEIGRVEALFRYPVKSMRGEHLDAVDLGWHGVEGDRRFAFRRIHDRGEFPWLTAGKLPELLLFAPVRGKSGAVTHICTPAGEELPIFSEALATEVERRHGGPVEMMQMKHGIFDDACVSVITSATVHEICSLASHDSDVRRFRPNVVVRLLEPVPFKEDDWLGGFLSFGDSDDGPTVAVTARDVRCAMLNLHPDTARPSTEMMKAVVRTNDNNAGIYGTVTRTGRLSVGQALRFHASS